MEKTKTMAPDWGDNWDSTCKRSSRVKIVSDGTAGNSIVSLEDGTSLGSVQYAKWECSVEERLSKVTIQTILGLGEFFSLQADTNINFELESSDLKHLLEECLKAIKHYDKLKIYSDLTRKLENLTGGEQ